MLQAAAATAMHTTTEFFESVVLDSHVLSVAIVNRCDTLADDPEYSPQHYHKAAYRQWAMWQLAQLLGKIKYKGNLGN